MYIQNAQMWKAEKIFFFSAVSIITKRIKRYFFLLFSEMTQVLTGQNQVLQRNVCLQILLNKL